jgi:cytidine deaminase
MLSARTMRLLETNEVEDETEGKIAEQTILTDYRERLPDAAREAAGAAYSPHSNFRVGAAVLAGGRLFIGCNIENDSYGLTVCAERVAIFNAISSGCRRIDAIAIACPAGADRLVSMRVPCGACRQVMAQFANGDLPVIVDGLGEIPLAELMPKPFRL